MMESEQEAKVQHIAARYMEEVQAGLHPRLQDYFVRYPQYTDAIADFVVYYHAIEAYLPQQEEAAATALPPSVSALLPKIQQRVLSSLSGEQPSLGMTSLFLTTRQEAQDEIRLAKALNLSKDIVMALEQRKVLPETLPLALLQRLSMLTGYSLREVQQFLGASSDYRQPEGASLTSSARVAESRGVYTPKYSFLEIIEASATLSQEQKRYWREVIEGEK